MRIENKSVIYDVKGVERKSFQVLSDISVPLYRGLELAISSNSFLPSSIEAAALRVAINTEKEGKPYRSAVNRRLLTSTLVGYTVVDGSLFGIVYDVPGKDRNAFLKLAKQGCELHNSGKELVVGINQTFAKHIRKSVDTSTGRRYAVPEKNKDISLATGAQAPTPFGAHESACALLDAQAEPYSSMLRAKGYSKGHVWTLNQDDLKNIDKKHMLIRPVRLGGDYFYIFDSVIAYGVFNIIGLALGVRDAKNFSNKK